MRVLVVSEVALGNTNGVTTTLRHLVLQGRTRADRLLIAAPRGRSPAAHFGKAGAEVRLLPSVGLPWYPEVHLALPWRRTVRRLIRDAEPDLVHLVDPFWFGAAAGAHAAREGIPVIASFHTHLPAYTRWYGHHVLTEWAWRLCRRAYHHASLILVPTEAIGRELTERGITPVTVWPRGVDCNLFHPGGRSHALRAQLLGERRHLVLYVGRLAREKRVEFLIEALLPCRDVRLVLVGDGPLERPLRRRYEPQGVVFTGKLSGEKLVRHYASSDLFVFASETETYGQVLTEALASGLPVVASRNPVVSEVLGRAGEPGAFDAGDADQLRATVHQLLADDTQRFQLGLAGRDLVEGRTWDATIDLLFELYQRVREEAAG
jgi:phosphatidylinositol alpha 1,6-mannosyltransferase